MEYFQIAKTNMVKNQLMPNHVPDSRVLDSFMEVDRHTFVDGDWQTIAYSDARLPIADGRSMLAPEVHGRMLSALQLNGKEKILDVACGNGYSAAILSHLCKKVVAIESDTHLASKATNNIVFMNLHNVEVKTAELLAGDQKEGPFDCIIVNGALDAEPANLISQLKKDGKLIYIHKVSEHLCKVMLCQNFGHAVGRTELFDTFCESL